MSIKYSPRVCENCGREQAGTTSWGQNVILALLIPTIIGAILYYYLGTPNCCYICGLKRRHRKSKKD